MLLQTFGSCYVKNTRMRLKASILFKISWVIFLVTRYLCSVPRIRKCDTVSIDILLRFGLAFFALLAMLLYAMIRISGGLIRQSERSHIAIHSVSTFRSESIGLSAVFLKPSLAAR